MLRIWIPFFAFIAITVLPQSRDAHAGSKSKAPQPKIVRSPYEPGYTGPRPKFGTSSERIIEIDAATRRTLIPAVIGLIDSYSDIRETPNGAILKLVTDSVISSQMGESWEEIYVPEAMERRSPLLGLSRNLIWGDTAMKAGTPDTAEAPELMTYDEAVQYCTSRGAHLPRRHEWMRLWDMMGGSEIPGEINPTLVKDTPSSMPSLLPHLDQSETPVLYWEVEGWSLPMPPANKAWQGTFTYEDDKTKKLRVRCIWGKDTFGMVMG